MQNKKIVTFSNTTSVVLRREISTQVPLIIKVQIKKKNRKKKGKKENNKKPTPQTV